MLGPSRMDEVSVRIGVGDMPQCEVAPVPAHAA